MTEMDAPARPRRRAGLVGAAIGAAAAGVAAGIAAERALVRRGIRGVTDPYLEEPFGQLPYDESLTVTTDGGVDLHVEVVEPADGVEFDAGFLVAGAGTKEPPAEPTIVLSHGFCLDMGTFYFQRKELTRRGDYRVVAYDQPGHGRSGRLSTGDYELEDLGHALRSVLEATVPDGPVVLVGHSMGGMAIMAFAEMYPHWFGERIAGVVLISTSGGELDEVALGVPDPIARLGRALIPLINNTARLTAGAVDRARQASTDLTWLLTRRYGFGDARPSPALVSFVERMNAATPTETVARYLRTLYGHDRYLALEALRATPVLVICGDKDLITPVEHSAEICRHLPDAEFLVIPGGGHMALLARADEINAALLAFLEKINP